MVRQSTSHGFNQFQVGNEKRAPGWLLGIGDEVHYPVICAMVKSRYIGDGHPTFNRNPYNGYINPYYWVDDHPLLYGNI